MKKHLLTLFAILAFGSLQAQDLQKGNILGIHTLTIALDPNASLNEYTDYYSNKLLPALRKEFPDAGIYMLKGKRGLAENQFGFIWVFKSDADRNKYFGSDGNLTDLGNKAMQNIQTQSDELSRLGSWTSTYTDWEVL